MEILFDNILEEIKSIETENNSFDEGSKTSAFSACPTKCSTFDSDTSTNIKTPSCPIHRAKIDVPEILIKTVDRKNSTDTRDQSPSRVKIDVSDTVIKSSRGFAGSGISIIKFSKLFKAGTSSGSIGAFNSNGNDCFSGAKSLSEENYSASSTKSVSSNDVFSDTQYVSDENGSFCSTKAEESKDKHNKQRIDTIDRAVWDLLVGIFGSLDAGETDVQSIKQDPDVMDAIFQDEWDLFSRLSLHNILNPKYEKQNIASDKEMDDSDNGKMGSEADILKGLKCKKRREKTCCFQLPMASFRPLKKKAITNLRKTRSNSSDGTDSIAGSVVFSGGGSSSNDGNDGEFEGCILRNPVTRKLCSLLKRNELQGADRGHNELWRKRILIGKRCRPLDFSGAVHYDESGNLLNEPPKKAERRIP